MIRLEEFVNFCVREMFDIMKKKNPQKDLSSKYSPPVKAIKKKYHICLEKASKLYSPVFWRMTHDYEAYYKKAPISCELNGLWVLNPRYKNPSEDRIKRIVNYIIKHEKSFLTVNLGMINGTMDCYGRPIEKKKK